MDATEGSLSLVESFFQQILGKICWSVVAGSGTGSMVSIDIGRQIPRQRQLKNSTLSDTQRKFDGEFDIFIKDALWEVEAHGEIVCDNDDDNCADGPMLAGLRQLVNRTVLAATLTGERGDFELTFDGDIRLLVSCIESTDDFMDNYSLFTLEKAVTVTADGRVTVEE